MIGDSLSDAHAKLTQDVAYYSDEFERLPLHLQALVNTLLEQLDNTRAVIDYHQNVVAFETEDERDHRETLPGEEAAEDISYKFSPLDEPDEDWDGSRPLA